MNTTTTILFIIAAIIIITHFELDVAVHVFCPYLFAQAVQGQRHGLVLSEYVIILSCFSNKPHRYFQAQISTQVQMSGHSSPPSWFAVVLDYLHERRHDRPPLHTSIVPHLLVHWHLLLRSVRYFTLTQTHVVHFNTTHLDVWTTHLHVHLSVKFTNLQLNAFTHDHCLIFSLHH